MDARDCQGIADGDHHTDKLFYTENNNIFIEKWNMKVVLTGATGFLGNHLLDELLRGHYEIIIIKRQSSNIKNIIKKYGSLRAWDIEKIDDLFKIHPDVDALIHAATDYGNDELNPTEPFFANEFFPMKLLALAIRHKIATFINFDTFFSSAKEEYSYLETYTMSKRHFKEWGQYCAKNKKIGFCNLQLFHLYGEGDNSKKFVPTMIANCLKGGEINLTDGVQKRDFIYISDVVSAVKIILIAEASREPGYRHYDIGTGNSISIRDFVEKVKFVCGSNVRLNFGALPNRKGEFTNSFADTTALHKLGWVPKVTIEMGIKSMVKDIKRKMSPSNITLKKND